MILAALLTISLVWPRPIPQPKDLPKPHKTVWHNYMGIDGHLLHCTGLPYHTVDFRIFVDGCWDKTVPQELKQ